MRNPQLFDGARPGRKGPGNPNSDDLLRSTSIRYHWVGKIACFFWLMVFLFGSRTIHAQTSMGEYQVKALFLCNFVKYVDWPDNASSPIIIGILGQDNFNGSLAHAVEGKNFNGRPIIIKHLSTDDDVGGCAILFISASENSRLDEILGKTGTLPILTVGEDETFLQKGGIINFALKEDKIHLQINLKVAQKVNLQISSKLLSVADIVNE
jgi:YfiR/HmsC-like